MIFCFEDDKCKINGTLTKRTWTTSPKWIAQIMQKHFLAKSQSRYVKRLQAFSEMNSLSTFLLSQSLITCFQSLKRLLQDRITYYPSTFCTVLRKHRSWRWDPPSWWKSWDSLFICPSCVSVKKRWKRDLELWIAIEYEMLIFSQLFSIKNS